MYFARILNLGVSVESWAGGQRLVGDFEWASVGNIYPPGGGKINEVFSHYSLLIRYSVFTIGKRVFNCN